MRADDEIVVVDLEVAHRRDRQVELERLPRVAIVQGDEGTTFRPAHEKSASVRVFLHRVHVDTRWQSVRDRLPRLPEVAGPEEVGLKILELVPVDARIGNIRVEVRRLHLRHSAPWRDGRRRHVLPVCTIIRGEMDQAIICAEPELRCT